MATAAKKAPAKKAAAAPKSAPAKKVGWTRVHPQLWVTDDHAYSVEWGKTSDGTLTWLAKKGDKVIGPDEPTDLADARAIVEAAAK